MKTSPDYDYNEPEDWGIFVNSSSGDRYLAPIDHFNLAIDPDLVTLNDNHNVEFTGRTLKQVINEYVEDGDLESAVYRLLGDI